METNKVIPLNVRFKHQRRKAKVIIDVEFQVKSIKIKTKSYSALPISSIVEHEGKKYNPNEYFLLSDNVQELEIIEMVKAFVDAFKNKIKEDKREIHHEHTTVYGE